jgi:REP element-mobilizing transposase RayT
MKDMENWDNFIASIKCEGITLTEPGIAQIIQSTFNFYDNKLYDLHCYCIMPNHIHLLIKPLTDEKGESYHLSDIIKRIKTYTAKMINQELKRTGKVWEDDYFDRIIRNEQDYYNVINYYLKNPVKARLVDYIKDWEYSYFKFG